MPFMTIAHLFVAVILIVFVVLLMLLLIEQRRSNRIRQDEITLHLRNQLMTLRRTIAAAEELANLYYLPHLGDSRGRLML